MREKTLVTERMKASQVKSTKMGTSKKMSYTKRLVMLVSCRLRRLAQSRERVEEGEAEYQGHPCPCQRRIPSGEGDGSMARRHRRCVPIGEEP
jgi:hypothetical protein